MSAQERPLCPLTRTFAVRKVTAVTVGDQSFKFWRTDGSHGGSQGRRFSTARMSPSGLELPGQASVHSGGFRFDEATTPRGALPSGCGCGTFCPAAQALRDALRRQRYCHTRHVSSYTCSITAPLGARTPVRLEAVRVEAGPGQAEHWFNERGCCVDWTKRRYRIRGETHLGVAFTSPPWIRRQIQHDIRHRGGFRIRVQESEWLDHYGFNGPVSPEVVAMLNQLGTVMSIGRKPSQLDQCFALDFYKCPVDDLDSMRWPNTEAGELVNRSKYRSGNVSDQAFDSLVDKMARFVRSQPLLAAADCVVSIPGRFSNRVGHGELLAKEVAAATGSLFTARRRCMKSGPQPRRERPCAPTRWK